MPEIDKQQQEDLKLITNLTEHMKQTEMMARNYVRVLAEIKEVRDTNSKNINSLWEKIGDLEKEIEELKSKNRVPDITITGPR